MEQTAVEFYNSKIKLFESWVETKQISWKEYHKEKDNLIEQAKEMFEQQIIEAWDKGDCCIDLPDGGWEQKYKSGEQYYNETFKLE